MEYTVKALAALAGVSGRTLRFYDQIGLLRPKRINDSGYRVYGSEEVDRLQQILFYRELGFPLADIAGALDSDAFDRLTALRAHLAALSAKKERILSLIGTVNKTIQNEEGMIQMEDREKFEGFKKQLIEENERAYGEEIRQKYGEEAVDASNRRMMGLSKAQYDEMQRLSGALQALLERSVREGLSADGDAGREAARLHRQWLSFSWAEYSVEAHKGLAQMYVDDTRFTAHYDAQTPGCAAFLCDAVHRWAGAQD